jgi:hypothetical protein
MTPISPLPVDGEILLRLNKIPSLNMFYAGKHWTHRKRYKDTIVEDITNQLEQYDKVTFKTMEVIFICNYRMDLDNCIMGVKFALDAFRRWGGIQDDSPKYVKRIKMQVDKELQANEGIIYFKKMS